MDALAVSELMRLEALSDEDLKHLPPLGTREERIADGRVKIDCFHRVNEAGAHVIAVVAWRPNARGLWDEPHVEGFVIDGAARRPLTQEESWEFT